MRRSREAVSLLVSELGDVPLIGFAGAPFTLASYLVEGGPSRHHERTKAMMLGEPDTWHALMTTLTDVTIAFLQTQVTAGVDAIQVFDSWAGHAVAGRLPQLRAAAQHAGVLGARGRRRADDPFRGRHRRTARRDVRGVRRRARCVGVDWRTSLTDAAARVQPGTALQGNLDPVVLLAGWPVAERAVRAVVEDGRRAVDAGAAGHIFNLGHGVLPGTDPGVITDVVALVHSL